MKVAFIAPTYLLHDQGELWGTYHLVLAQVCLSDPAYLDFYRRRSVSGDTIILDNGAYELSEGISADQLLKVAHDLLPSVVVIPDVRFSRRATFQRAQHTIPTLRNPKWKLMAVPQAPLDDFDEYVRSVSELSQLDGVDMIGIYPETDQYFPLRGRPALLETLERMGLIHPQLGYHMLGMNERLHEVAELAKFPYVVGIDSAKPVVYGLYGVQLHPNGGTKVPYMHRPEGYFQLKGNPFPHIVRANVRVIQDWADGGANVSD